MPAWPAGAVGRFLALILMFMGVCVFAVLAGEISGAMTATSTTRGMIASIGDLTAVNRIQIVVCSCWSGPVATGDFDNCS